MRAASPVVAKFGGSSFRDPSDYHDVAKHLLTRVEESPAGVVAVVSAQPGETENLRGRLEAVHRNPAPQTTAGLLTLADVVSAHLLTAAIQAAGGRACTVAAQQSGTVTDSRWMWARIEHLDPRPLNRLLTQNDIVVMPGGPACNQEGQPTWMGKNSSDLAATAAAVIVGAEIVDIYSDVDGVYTADPALIDDARMLHTLDFSTAALLAGRGAKVLHRRALALAQQHGLIIRCRLNRGPFQRGTELSDRGEATAAVVVDLRSQVVQFSDDETADRAHAAFDRFGVQSVRPHDLDPPLAVITGGYTDVDALLDSAGFQGRRIPGRLVSVITGGAIESHLAHDDAAAIQLGRGLHRQLAT